MSKQCIKCGKKDHAEGWGGKRKGAGPKSIGNKKRIQLSATVSPKTMKIIDKQSSKLNLSRGQVIDKAFE